LEWYAPTLRDANGNTVPRPIPAEIACDTQKLLKHLADYSQVGESGTPREDSERGLQFLYCWDDAGSKAAEYGIVVPGVTDVVASYKLVYEFRDLCRDAAAVLPDSVIPTTPQQLSTEYPGLGGYGPGEHHRVRAWFDLLLHHRGGFKPEPLRDGCYAYAGTCIATLQGNPFAASVALIDQLCRQVGGTTAPIDHPQRRGKVAIDYEDETILRHLSKTSPRLQTVYDIEAETRITKKTVSKRLTALIETGLAERPKGKRSGITITSTGRGVLQEIDVTSPAQ